MQPPSPGAPAEGALRPGEVLQRRVPADVLSRVDLLVPMRLLGPEDVALIVGRQVCRTHSPVHATPVAASHGALNLPPFAAGRGHCVPVNSGEGICGARTRSAGVAGAAGARQGQRGAACGGWTGTREPLADSGSPRVKRRLVVCRRPPFGSTCFPRWPRSCFGRLTGPFDCVLPWVPAVSRPNISSYSVASKPPSLWIARTLNPEESLDDICI